MIKKGYCIVCGKPVKPEKKYKLILCGNSDGVRSTKYSAEVCAECFRPLKNQLFVKDEYAGIVQ